MQTEDSHVKVQAESSAATRQGMPMIAGSHEMLEEARKHSFLEAFRGSMAIVTP